MWKRYFALLTILKIINLSVQQSCEFNCLTDSLSDKNCVFENETRIIANLHETEGSVDLQFDFVCDIETYDIFVKYSENSNCSIKNELIEHSGYSFKKIRDSSERNFTQLEKCAGKGKVLLQKIVTGCYAIYIIDKEDIISKKYFFWTTSYRKQEVDFSHDSRNNGTELIFIIKNPILNSHSQPEFSLQFECKNCPKYLSKEHYYSLLQDETDSKKMILDPKDKNSYLNIFCILEQNIGEPLYASCYISPVVVGHYNIIVTFIGNPFKCVYDEYERYKYIVNDIVVEANELLEQPLKYFEKGTIFGPLVTVICILLLFSIVIFIIQSTKIKICRFGNKNIEEFLDDKNVNTKINTDDGSGENEAKPILLLLYARNSEDFMTTLSFFRNILMYQGIEVFDIYDPERLSEINENNLNWILNLTSRKDLKIILFLTPSALNLCNLPQIQNSLDNIYPFAMKHLLSKISLDNEFYKKIFVAYFSFDFNKYSDYDIFCPYLRFRVPDDFLALLQRICNTKQISLNCKSNNEYNKFMEHYEKYKFLQENIIYHI